MTKLSTRINRLVFDIFYTLASKEATKWLNKKLETARIIDEEMEWEPNLS